MTVSHQSGAFPVGHVFQRGDLPFYVSDVSGQPMSPYKVRYTMHYRRQGSGCYAPAGCIEHTPVCAGVGEYYVSGVAGQDGQPGDWQVHWVYQESYSSPEREAIFGFKVYDEGTLRAQTGCQHHSNTFCGRCR